MAARRIGEIVPAEQGKRMDKELVQTSDKFDIPKQRLSEFRKLAKMSISEFKKRIESLKHGLILASFCQRDDCIHDILSCFNFSLTSCEAFFGLIAGKKVFEVERNRKSRVHCLSKFRACLGR